jgi:hypothetical protein
MPRMSSASFTFFFMSDRQATDVSVPREWTKRRPSSSQAATIVWAPAR